MRGVRSRSKSRSAREVLVLLDRQGFHVGRQRLGPFVNNGRMRNGPQRRSTGGEREKGGEKKSRQEIHMAALGAVCGGSGAAQGRKYPKTASKIDPLAAEREV
jgi:hypothetical protein